jgi:hypothetical protein
MTKRAGKEGGVVYRHDFNVNVADCLVAARVYS